MQHHFLFWLQRLTMHEKVASRRDDNESRELARASATSVATRDATPMATCHEDC